MPVTPTLSAHQRKLAAAAEALQRGRVAEGEALLREVLASRPSNAEALWQLGQLTMRAGRVNEAERLFGRLTRAEPKSAAAHTSRGFALAHLGRLNEALASFERVVALTPRDSDAWSNRGIALTNLRRTVDAAASFRKAVELRPDNGHAHNNLGIALTNLGRFPDAIASFDRAIGLMPGNAEYHVNRGVTFGHMAQFEDALDSYDRAAALVGVFMEAHRGRAGALENLARYDEALLAYDQALALAPQDVGALTGRANVNYAMGQHDQALTDYAAATGVDANYADAHWDESLCRLAMGDYEHGWEKYEWRWKSALAHAKPAIPGSPWLGDTPIEGKTILVLGEQGLGDSLQFCRYLPTLAARARVILEVPRPLAGLLAKLEGVSAVIVAGDRRPAFDAWAPMMSLPLAFRTTLATIPATVPYLRADPEQTAGWRDRLASLPGRKVGLVWSGAPRPEDPHSYAIDRRRSMTLAHFAPLASVPGVSLISLQKGAPAEQTKNPPDGMTLHDWTDELDDFENTAALVEALDLVIAVDTSVAHLAGGLGKPVWVLNRFDLCWRWLRNRTSSPWYPTARLFHQQTPGAWPDAMRDVAAALRAW
ncbi:MAG: glycosyltransferase family 41 protein [Acetobacteraceae bacterium]|nr:glycosyltransferase family 41 protein [Acetobacteraceae bacterium]